METFRKLRGALGVPLVLLLAARGVVPGQQRPPVGELLSRFESTPVFWQQFEVAKEIAAARDVNVLPKLEKWLTNEDRHLRGNAAYLFSALGDHRGFEVIVAILGDRSERGEGQGIPNGRWSLKGQIGADRYYAAHLLGDLKDPQGVAVLVPLLKDPEVNTVAPWSLGMIGDRAAVQPLIDMLRDPDAGLRVLAVYALGDLKAAEALPALRQLLGDNERANFGKLESVADAARAAIAKLQAPPR